jgi:hypothetical protein
VSVVIAEEKVLSLWEYAEAMAQAIQERLEIEIKGIQIVPYPLFKPVQPAIDIYPGSPFQEGAAFGSGDHLVHWVVRARVSTADQVSGFRLLLRLLDPNDPASVQRALEDAGYVVGSDGSVSDFQVYTEQDGRQLIGCEWVVEHFL